jgi:hypothetical protein
MARVSAAAATLGAIALFAVATAIVAGWGQRLSAPAPAPEGLKPSDVEDGVAAAAAAGEGGGSGGGGGTGGGERDDGEHRGDDGQGEEGYYVSGGRVLSSSLDSVRLPALLTNIHYVPKGREGTDMHLMYSEHSHNEPHGTHTDGEQWRALRHSHT